MEAKKNWEAPKLWNLKGDETEVSSNPSLGRTEGVHFAPSYTGSIFS